MWFIFSILIWNIEINGLVHRFCDTLPLTLISLPLGWPWGHHLRPSWHCTAWIERRTRCPWQRFSGEEPGRGYCCRPPVGGEDITVLHHTTTQLHKCHAWPTTTKVKIFLRVKVPIKFWVTPLLLEKLLHKLEKWTICIFIHIIKVLIDH